MIKEEFLFSPNLEKKQDFNVYYPTEKDTDMAFEVSNWTKKYGNMLPKTPDEILVFFRSKDSVVIINKEDLLVSHAALVATYPDNWRELGSVATNENFRNMGAASIAVKEAIKLGLDKDRTSKIFALANSKSSKLFEKLGAEKLLSTQLPNEVWKPCLKCPNYKPPKEGVIFQCCDTPYKLTNIIR
jgi:N-acetylglutamate synthase-like GNAT family acetyltransferase